MSPAKSRGTKISNPCPSNRETGELSVPKRRPVRCKAPAPEAIGSQTCMGLFLSSSHFWLFGDSLFGAGMPFFVPSPAIRFAERGEGVKGPKRLAKLGGLPLSGACVSQRPLFKPGAGFEA